MAMGSFVPSVFRSWEKYRSNRVKEGIDVFKIELKYGLDDKTHEADPPSKGARAGAKPDQSKTSLLEIAQE